MNLEKLVKNSKVNFYDDLSDEELRSTLYLKISEILRLGVVCCEWARTRVMNKNIMNAILEENNLSCKNETTEFLIDKTEFQNIVNEKLDIFTEYVKLEENSLDILQKAIECYAIDLLKEAKVQCKKRNNTFDIEPKDINLAKKIQNEC